MRPVKVVRQTCLLEASKMQHCMSMTAKRTCIECLRVKAHSFSDLFFESAGPLTQCMQTSELEDPETVLVAAVWRHEIFRLVLRVCVAIETVYGPGFGRIARC